MYPRLCEENAAAICMTETETSTISIRLKSDLYLRYRIEEILYAIVATILHVYTNLAYIWTRVQSWSLLHIVFNKENHTEYENASNAMYGTQDIVQIFLSYIRYCITLKEPFAECQ